MPILTLILYLIASVLLFWLLLPLVLVLVSRFFPKPKIKPQNKAKANFACIITAYKDVSLAHQLVESLITQNYRHYHIYLVADQCNKADWTIEHQRLTAIFPEQPLNAKLKSIIAATEAFVRDHSHILIFDPDNLAEPDYLNKVNTYHQAGFTSVQTRRTAKNLNTVYARLDALGEIYKNFIERDVPFRLGSSPTIAGSGMSISTTDYLNYLQLPSLQRKLNSGTVVVAEDKVLHNYLLQENIRIAYANDIPLYDEKISTGAQVQRQRTRWLYAYFENVGKSIRVMVRGFLEGSTNLWLFGLLSLFPPLFLLVLSSLLVGLLGLLVDYELSLFVGAGLVAFTLAILLSLVFSKAPKAVWAAIPAVPIFIIKQLLALFNIGKARKDFLVTKHKGEVSLKDVPKD